MKSILKNNNNYISRQIFTTNNLVGYNLRSKYVAKIYFIYEDMFLYMH